MSVIKYPPLRNSSIFLPQEFNYQDKNNVRYKDVETIFKTLDDGIVNVNTSNTANILTNTNNITTLNTQMTTANTNITTLQTKTTDLSYSSGITTLSGMKFKNIASCISIGDTANYTNTQINNVAVGFYANSMNNNPHNVCCGNEAGRYIVGSGNVSVGTYSLRGQSSGAVNNNNNTALGNNCLFSCNSANNTGCGSMSLQNLTTGANNTSVGFENLKNITTANNLTMVGYQNGLGLTTLTGAVNTQNTTAIGYNACPSHITSANNCVFLGYNAGNNSGASSQNAVFLGNTSIGAVYQQIASTITSDIRDKTDIIELKQILPSSLNFINQVEPIVYKLNNRDRYEEGEINDGSKKDLKFSCGVSAQNIKQLEDNLINDEYNYLIVSDDLGENKLTANYTSIIPMLINAIKEQNQIINDLKTRIEILENQ